MNGFVKGVYYDFLNRITKLIKTLHGPEIHQDVDKNFLQKTAEMLSDLHGEVKEIIDSGDLDVPKLSKYYVSQFNTFHERLLNIELFRFLVIINFGEPEIYFRKKIKRIYKEINCFQVPPIITTISNSENYFWALPNYDIIAVPSGEEKSLLNMPDLFHEIGHLIYFQYELFLKGKIEQTLKGFYDQQIVNVDLEDRNPELKAFYREKYIRWINAWIMEFCCDMIATYLVGPAYGWSNFKLATVGLNKNKTYKDTPSHPSDEARMRAILTMLQKTGYLTEASQIKRSWDEFLNAANKPVPSNYDEIFPDDVIGTLADSIISGCVAIDLRSYAEQITEHAEPISHILNMAWDNIMAKPFQFEAWEKNVIEGIRTRVENV
ncbi:hypothetical protein [Mucilaginibacter sp. L3T2-6]|uniref:hypothetical protein n=1 Tax=Mucilaginibacter sp. L3T2-6 TaxID=3062491 RepID=UPI002675123C|nr:hypothetical protein [Mucilaginibacter sp. L3T2-6]MDO3641503.1 hypothetical protein [Mucilaginibacter sp. L3T2-6]MDV6213736.1 hypothetical protein [Mucilaginibacter sp. L3T2-6]